jgi:hypothetical protein
MGHIRKHFPVQDCEPVSCFLGIGFSQDLVKGTVSLEQKGAVEALLQEVGLKHKCHKKVPLPPGVKVLPFDGPCTDRYRKEYQSKVAKAICLQGCDPSMCQAVSKLASVASNPSAEHMRLLTTYLLPCLGKNLAESGIRFNRDSCYKGPPNKDPALRKNGLTSSDCALHHFNVQLFVDANFIDDFVDCKCRGGHMIRVAGGPAKVLSKKQTLVASHTQEAEHIQKAVGINDGRVVINFMDECGFPLKKPISLFEDNMSCCKLATAMNTSTQVAQSMFLCATTL